MQPRLKTSKKWTPLPKEFLRQVESVFKQTFKAQIGTGKIITDGRIYPEEILVSVGFKGAASGLKQSNFEISIEYKKNKDNVLTLLNLSVDVAASLFEQYFGADDDQDFPRIWQEFDVDNRAVYVQYSTTNSELESAANKFLGEHAEEGLAGGDWDDDEGTADAIKASLGIDPEDKGEDSVLNDKKKRH